MQIAIKGPAITHPQIICFIAAIPRHSTRERKSWPPKLMKMSPLKFIAHTQRSCLMPLEKCIVLLGRIYPSTLAWSSKTCRSILRFDIFENRDYASYESGNHKMAFYWWNWLSGSYISVCWTHTLNVCLDDCIVICESSCMLISLHWHGL
jgi:hypothetical protein